MACGPGLHPAPNLFLLAVLGVVWPRHMALSPPHHPSGMYVIMWSGMDTLNSTFLWHFSLKRIWWSDQSMGSLPCWHLSLPIHHIIEPSGLLYYHDIIPFVRWWNLNAKPSFVLPTFAMFNVCKKGPWSQLHQLHNYTLCVYSLLTWSMSLFRIHVKLWDKS